MESGDKEKQGKKNKTKERRATKKNETKEDSEKKGKNIIKEIYGSSTQKERRKREEAQIEIGCVRASVCLGSTRPASLFCCFVSRCIVCVCFFLLFTATAGVSSLERCIRAVL